MNRLRRTIERTCATAHISIREDTPTESLLSPTHAKLSPLSQSPLIPDNYLNLIVECVVDTMLSTCFNSHAKGLDLNSNAPFAKQDSILMGDDEDDDKVSSRLFQHLYYTSKFNLLLYQYIRVHPCLPISDLFLCSHQ